MMWNSAGQWIRCVEDEDVQDVVSCRLEIKREDIQRQMQRQMRMQKQLQLEAQEELQKQQDASLAMKELSLQLLVISCKLSQFLAISCIF